ncbi:MAG: heme ABC exporter ATP-binding protein CcmA [Nannocystaceae bacterium]
MSDSIIPCELRAVVKSFGRTSVLRGVSLRLEAGQITGLSGINGAGKTTLFRILAGLEDADEGEIQFGALEDAGVHEGVREQIAFVTHAPQLYPSLTARENLEFFAALRTARGRATMPASEALTAVGLDIVHDRPVRTFSRGMAQRVVLARALAARPMLMLLDEPFTALDAEGQELVGRLLRDAKGRGASVLLSSHDLDRLCEVSDRVVQLHEGRLGESLDRAPEETGAGMKARLQRAKGASV